MTTTYTPLTLSKLIAERLPALKTEVWWNGYGTQSEPREWKLNNTYRLSEDRSCNAYTFTDCLRAIEMIGEKDGWDNLSSLPNEANRRIDQKSHELLQQYMRDHHTIGEHTIAYLTELFTKKK